MPLCLALASALCALSFRPPLALDGNGVRRTDGIVTGLLQVADAQTGQTTSYRVDYSFSPADHPRIDTGQQVTAPFWQDLTLGDRVLVRYMEADTFAHAIDPDFAQPAATAPLIAAALLGLAGLVSGVWTVPRAGSA